MKTLHVPDDIIADVERLYTRGSPASFFYEESIVDSTTYFEYGNHGSVDNNIAVALDTINTEEKYSYCIPLPSWVCRYLLYAHRNPHAVLQKADKAPRLTSDGSFLPHPLATSVNLMHSNEYEPQLVYGDALLRNLTSIWNTRITYADDAIWLFDDDVAAAFRVAKYHPDIAGAFCHILCGLVLISVGQTFGSRERMHIATQLSHLSNNHLVTKYSRLIDKIEFANPFH